ncbi:hypothetical protein Ancab_020680 [Ancistrocladus abbreviatus]
MGRAKLAMKLRTEEKARNITFQKRKNGLKKKAFELSTLCNIPVCLIIYGYKKDGHLAEPDIWPSNHVEVRKIIDKYNAIPRYDRNKRAVNLLDILEGRKRKAEQDLFKLRRKIMKAKYPTWHACFDSFSKAQLLELVLNLDGRIDDLKTRIALMKGKQVVGSSAFPFSLLPCMIPTLNQQWQQHSGDQFMSVDQIMNEDSQIPTSFDPNPFTLTKRRNDVGFMQMGNDITSNNTRFAHAMDPMNPMIGYDNGASSAVVNNKVANGSGPSMWWYDPAYLQPNPIQLGMQPDVMTLKSGNEFEMNGSSYCDFNDLDKVFYK